MSTTWNKIRFDISGDLFQEIDEYGNVIRYVDTNGAITASPLGGSRVLEENYEPTPQMTALANVREAATQAERIAIRTDAIRIRKLALIESLDAWEALVDPSDIVVLARISELRGLTSF